MKKLLLTGIAVLFLATGTAHAQTHNADFPVQMAAINNCYLLAHYNRKTGDGYG